MTDKPEKPVLLSGGNPQIPKGHGVAPVQAWIAAAPGWKKRRRPPPRRPDYAHGSRGAEGGQMEHPAVRP